MSPTPTTGISRHEIDVAEPWPLVHSWPLPIARMAGSRSGACAEVAEPDALKRLRGVGVWECDLHGDRLAWTKPVFDLFGLPDDMRVERPDAVAIYAPESREAMELLRAYAIRHRRGFTLDAELERPDGTVRRMRLTAGLLCEGGRPRWLYGTKEDLSREQARRDRMKDAEGADPVTGLLAGDMALARLLVGNGETERMALIVQAGGAAWLEKRFGQAACDACLAALASRLVHGLGERAMILRDGEHGFIAFFDRPETEAVIDSKLRRLLEELARPVYWKGYLLGVKPSMVFARGKDDEATLAVARERMRQVIRRSEADPLAFSLLRDR